MLGAIACGWVAPGQPAFQMVSLVVSALEGRTSSTLAASGSSRSGAETRTGSDLESSAADSPTESRLSARPTGSERTA
jgi:hypothetical protein